MSHDSRLQVYHDLIAHGKRKREKVERIISRLFKLGNFTLKAPNQEVLRAGLVVAEDALGTAITCVKGVSSATIQHLAHIPVSDASGGTKQRIQSLVKVKDFDVAGAVD